MHVLYGILLGEEARVDQKLLFIEIRFDTNYDSNWEYVPSHIVALKRCILNLDSSDLTSKHTYGSFKLDSQNLIEF